MATFYAWNNFDVERDEWGRSVNRINVGEEISQSKLKISDEEWQELVDIGAVREDKYPEDLPPDKAPAEYEREKYGEAMASGQVVEAMKYMEENPPDESEITGGEKQIAPKTPAQTPPSQSTTTTTTTK
jgi:hypothetical protein